MKVIISLVGFILFTIYSPAATHKKPLKDNYGLLKIKSLIVLDIYCIAGFMLDNKIGTLLIICVMIQMLFITPIAYKLLSVPYIYRRR